MDKLADVSGGSYKLNTGFHIPLVGLGTYKITGDLVLPAVEAALSSGYRMFDTAKYYHNEPELGIALKELLPKFALKREDIFLTTKFFPDSKEPAVAAKKLVQESLDNLQTSYIDMCMIHYPKDNASDNENADNAKHRRETYIALEEMKAEGKIRSVGVSNFEVCHLKEIKKFGKMMPCANQMEFHPHFTRDDVREYCTQEGIFFQAFSSLARHELKLIEDPHVVMLAQKHNTTVPLILLAWARSQNIGIVPKSASPSRIIDNFKVVDISLSQEEIDELLKLNMNQHYIRCTGWLVK